VIRVIHAADFHVGLHRYLVDPVTRLRDFWQAARRHDADIAIIAGDIFHTRGPWAARDVHAVAEVVSDLRDHLKAVVIVDGNHDGRDTVGDPDSAAMRWLDALAPGSVFLGTRVHDVLVADNLLARVVTMPYPHRQALDIARPDLAEEDREVEVGAEVERAIRDLGAALPDDVPRIFVGHLSVAGSKLGAEQVMRFGWDPAVSAGAFDDFDYAALGHIHRQQRVGRTAYYAGSPDYQDFSDAGQSKGFLLADIERGAEPIVRRIPSSAPPMVVVTAPEGPSRLLTAGAGTLDGFGTLSGAAVRFVLGPDAGPEDEEDVRRAARAAGAGYVDVVIPRADRRSQSAADAATLPQDLLAEWAAENVPDEERADVTRLGRELLAAASS
jgi:exonuclease SbcD